MTNKQTVTKKVTKTSVQNAKFTNVKLSDNSLLMIKGGSVWDEFIGEGVY